MQCLFTIRVHACVAHGNMHDITSYMNAMCLLMRFVVCAAATFFFARSIPIFHIFFVWFVVGFPLFGSNARNSPERNEEKFCVWLPFFSLAANVSYHRSTEQNPEFERILFDQKKKIRNEIKLK